VYFTPFHGGGAGFADQNRAKTLSLKSGEGIYDEATANIVDAFVDMVNRTADGGLIQLAIYGYSLRTPEHQALVDAVENRGVRLQVSIDTSVKNSRGVPYSADEVVALRRLDGDVTVKTLRFSSKTLHEKFAIFDGTHVMNGSANISTKANSRYAETRMFFWNNDSVTQAFEAEFDRLWNSLGVEPE
jgi:phosphatidylserine/phosphatidylglycerophosphate/cardiolipin synthase-like enzyme